MTIYDLQIYKGTSFSLTINLKDSNGNTLDLSTSIVSGYIRDRYSDTGILINLNPVIVTPTSGTINLSINAPTTSFTGLPITIGVYDVDVYNTGSGNFVTRALAGNVYIYPGVVM